MCIKTAEVQYYKSKVYFFRNQVHLIIQLATGIAAK